MSMLKYLIFGLGFLISGCHSDYLSLDYKLYQGSYSGGDSGELAIILKAEAYRNAEGLSRFPDGGMPEYLYTGIGLYLLDTMQNSIKRILLLEDLAGAGFNISNSLKVKTGITDSCVYYRISPVTDWDEYLKWCKSHSDSTQIISLKNKYRSAYKVKNGGKRAIVTDSIEFNYVVTDKQYSSLGDIYNILEKIPLSDIGLNIMDIYPKPEKSYIEETIYLKNNSSLTRRAVTEQIISQYNIKEIQELLDRMDSYRKSLEGTEKMEYELYSEQTYKQIKELL